MGEKGVVLLTLVCNGRWEHLEGGWVYQGQNAHKIMLIEETMSFGSVKSKIMEKLAVDRRCSELELKYLLDSKTEGCYPIQVDDESDWDAFKYCNSRGGDGTWPLPLYASVNEGHSHHGSLSMCGNMEQRNKSPGGDNRTLVVEEGGLVDMTVDGSNSHLLLNSDNGSNSTIDGKENTSSRKKNHTNGKVIQTARAEPTTATEETRGKLLDVDRGKQIVCLSSDEEDNINVGGHKGRVVSVNLASSPEEEYGNIGVLKLESIEETSSVGCISSDDEMYEAERWVSRRKHKFQAKSFIQVI